MPTPPDGALGSHTAHGPIPLSRPCRPETATRSGGQAREWVGPQATPDVGSLQNFTVAAGGVDWYVEQRGVGADVVLIPSGEGDCASFEKIAVDLAVDFRVTTFDTPGFSRSRAAEGVEISMVALGGQVAALVSTLGIQRATFYGCSSGGQAVLDLAVDHPHLVHRAIVHEAAILAEGDGSSLIQGLVTLDDAGISQTCEALFMNFMNEDPDAWRGLGEEFHARLAANYPRWVRDYVGNPKQHPPFDPAALAGKPITWTIGDLFEVRLFFSNVRLASLAGIEISTLPCRHFPQVSIPTVLADHIRTAALLST